MGGGLLSGVSTVGAHASQLCAGTDGPAWWRWHHRSGGTFLWSSSPSLPPPSGSQQVDSCHCCQQDEGKCAEVFKAQKPAGRVARQGAQTWVRLGIFHGEFASPEKRWDPSKLWNFLLVQNNLRVILGWVLVGLASILSLRLKGRPFDLLESLFPTQCRAGWWQCLLASPFYPRAQADSKAPFKSCLHCSCPKFPLPLVWSAWLSALIYSAFGAFKAEYSQWLISHPDSYHLSLQCILGYYIPKRQIR